MNPVRVTLEVPSCICRIHYIPLDVTDRLHVRKRRSVHA